jgi:hypothetical protein
MGRGGSRFFIIARVIPLGLDVGRGGSGLFDGMEKIVGLDMRRGVFFSL